METMSCGHPKSAIRPMKDGHGLTCGQCVDYYMQIAHNASSRDKPPNSSYEMSDAEATGFLLILGVFLALVISGTAVLLIEFFS